MPHESETEAPAQVPGDAESPPRTEADRTAREAVKRTDRTEPARGPDGAPKGKTPD